MRGPAVVSVIIPAYNRGATIARAVDSVLAQTLSDIEVIVVDDGSADDTAAIVQNMADPRIVLIRHDGNRGACAARNTGVAHANAGLIAFQDSDDEWMPDKLQRQLSAYKASGGGDVVVYCGFNKGNGAELTYVPEPDIEPRNGRLIPELLARNFISTQTLLLPRHCFEEVGGFLPELKRLQDWELAIRLADRFDFVLVDEPLVQVHETPGSISENTGAFAEAASIILQRHRDLYALHPRAEARMRAAVGNQLCLKGYFAQGRHHFIKAASLGHKIRFSFAALALSFCGSVAYRRVFAS